MTVEITKELLEEVQALNVQHQTWRDYTLFLLNTSDEPQRSGWRDKFITSMIHWIFNTGSVNESLIAGIEIMSELPDYLTQKVVDDAWNYNEWYRDGRLPGSKKQKVLLGHYAQEAHMVEAHKCLTYILNNWDEINPETGKPINHLIKDSEYLMKMWDFAQKSGGNMLLPDELLTYTLEKEVKETDPAYWTDVAADVFKNGIPSDKYKDSWRSSKMEQFPVAGYDFSEALFGENEWWKAYSSSLEEQKANFTGVIDIMLKEDLSNCPCWKRFAVVILKMDISGKYAGFAPTLKERKMREEALAVYSSNEKDRNKAIEEARLLEQRIKKEDEKLAKELKEEQDLAKVAQKAEETAQKQVEEAKENNSAKPEGNGNSVEAENAGKTDNQSKPDNSSKSKKNKKKKKK